VQGLDNGQQVKPTAHAAQVQRQAEQPQQGAAQRQQQAPRVQGQDKAPQGKGSAQEPKQGHANGSDKGEQQGGEHKK
jgi:hypothetical protein